MDKFDNVYQIMERKGITQKQLADHLNVSEQKVSDWKANRLKSWVKHIDKIAVFLGVTVAECLGLEISEKPADTINGLKEKLFETVMDFDDDMLLKLLDHASLLESAKRGTKGR